MESSNSKPCVWIEEKNSALLTSYKPLSYTEVRREVDTLQAVSAASMEEWKREVSMYEETFYDLDSEGRYVIEVPRRNYLNDDNEVKDTKLFPYHSACYPLLEAYTQTARRPSPFEAPIPGQLLCSPATINLTISGLSTELGPHSFRFGPTLVDEWNAGIERRLKASSDPDFWLRYQEIDRDFAHNNHYGLACFPVATEARADILLKLLRHAMSDLQNDHLLAGEVIVRMARWNLFQNVEYLRHILCIIGSELKTCSGDCFEHHWDGEDETEDEEIPDHSCIDWKHFQKKLSFMISTGIEYFTAEHALAIGGAMQLYFDKVNPAAAKLEASLVEETFGPNPKQSTKDKHRTMLKQKLYLSNNTYCDDDGDSDSEEIEEVGISETQQTNWTDEIVNGLAAHAILARQRVVELRNHVHQTTGQNGCGELILLLQKSIDAFHNCARCLVHIGEAALRRLPNNPRIVGFFSRLVLCLARMFVEPNVATFDHDRIDHRTYLKAGRSLIDPNRYADTILAATKNYRQHHFPVSPSVEECDGAVKQVIEEADCFLRTPPDKDVQNLIWCLFAKGLVDPMVSRCGYGDIQIWWGLPVTPLDPLIIFDECNIPMEHVFENAWDLDAEELIAWETDEEGSELLGDRLDARHDFSLVLLMCAWHAPWNVETHHSFQKPFREAVRTLFLCANRIHMPTDIVCQVCTYLRRDWWPDERAQCFSQECLEKRATKLLHQKLIHGAAGTSPTLKQSGRPARARQSSTSCPGCSVAFYCCEDHRQSDYRDRHKSLCKMPPLRIPGQKERELFNDVLCLQERESVPPVLNEEVRRLIESQLHGTVDADDDSGSWESVDTEEDEEEEGSESITDIVHRFFDRECYRRQRNDDDA